MIKIKWQRELIIVIGVCIMGFFPYKIWLDSYYSWFLFCVGSFSWFVLNRITLLLAKKYREKREKENYNWWEDSVNKEKVEKLSWWNHPENRTIVELPIAIVNDDKYWVAATVDDEKWLGEGLHSCSQGETRDEAIKDLFKMIRIRAEYADECRLNYQRWVPFRKGNWSSVGGKWIVIFGFHIYFRYGKKMQGGFYVPLTKLNVSFSSEWRLYREWKKRRENEKNS